MVVRVNVRMVKVGMHMRRDVMVMGWTHVAMVRYSNLLLHQMLLLLLLLHTICVTSW